jgi:predicted Holliday junction resolvase-like endonuclease
MDSFTLQDVVLVLVVVLVLALLVLARLWSSYSRLRETIHEEVRAGRKDAVQRSRSVTAGKVFEQLIPYLPHFSYNPKDARFLGSPIDFVVFDGLDEDRVDRVVFVEVKTGSSSLSTRERRVRDAIEDGRVEWRELRVDLDESGVKNK